MNWAETMKSNASATSQAYVDDESVVHRMQPASWHPCEVWLRRLKLPPDTDALLVPTITSNGDAINHRD